MEGVSIITTVNQKNAEVSIIVPAHNAEPFITKCLQSIQRQSFKNFEVLIVENASTDHTVEKVLAFTSQDKRFTLLRSPISGVSHARNLGLNEVHSKFVTFIDADDFMTEDHLQVLLDRINDAGSDMGVTAFSYESEDGKVLEAISVLKTKLSAEQAINSSYDFTGIQGVVFNKIFKKSIIDTYNIRFDSAIPKYEDHKFVVAYLLHCQMVSCDNTITYHYIRHPKSSLYTAKTSLIQDLGVYSTIRKMIVEQGFKDVSNYMEAPSQMIVLTHYWHPLNSEDKNEAAKRIVKKNFILYNMFNASLKNKVKLFLALLSLGPFWLSSKFRKNDASWKQ